MRRFSLFIIGLFLCYIIYYDLQIGTLPAVHSIPTTTQAAPMEKENTPSISFYERKIKQGDTVLSITEHHHGRLPTSINQIVHDFETLNSNVQAGDILYGQTYRFPDYNQ